MDRRACLFAALLLAGVPATPAWAGEADSGVRARVASQQGALGRWFEAWRDSPPATRQVSESLDRELLRRPAREVARTGPAQAPAEPAAASAVEPSVPSVELPAATEDAPSNQEFSFPGGKKKKAPSRRR